MMQALLSLGVIVAGIVFAMSSGLSGSIFLRPNISSSTPPAAPSATGVYVPPRQPTFVPSTPATTPTAVNPQNVPAGYTASNISPYYHKVRLAGPAAGYANFAGRIVLTINGLRAGERVNLTGWFVKSQYGSIYVPQAVNVYDPTGLSAATDIYAANGEQVSLFSSVSAAGTNFRLNKCIGYLDSSRTFNPALPGYCAPPVDFYTNPGRFTNQCLGYLQTLGGCRLPAPNPPVPVNDHACYDVLATWNYRGCFDAHRADADFLGQEWWVWTGYGSQFFSATHDRISLFDRNGKLVDEIVY